MIVSALADLRDQVVLTKNLETAIAFLQEKGQSTLPEGRLVLDGDNVFVEVQAYDTTEGQSTRFEGHRKYIDIQYIASGVETIGWAPLSAVAETDAYNSEHDYWLGQADPARITPIHLKTGELAVLYPTDPHAPRGASGASSPVKKLVVKVLIEG